MPNSPTPANGLTLPSTSSAPLASTTVVSAGGRRMQTPLAAAAYWGWNDVVQYLFDHGAKLDVKDSGGMSPIDAALGKAGGNSRGGQRIDVHEDTAALLRKLGAK